MSESPTAESKPPSSADTADDDGLLVLLHEHLADPAHDGILELLRDHPQQHDRLVALYADYQLAATMLRGQPTTEVPDRVLTELGRAAGTHREYVDLGVLARGGMAVIHRVRDPRLGRTLIKKVLPDSVHDATWNTKHVRRLARFLAEAQVMSGLQHPAILTVVDFGVDAQGRPFLVMPEVEGCTLDTVLADLRGRPDTSAAMVQLVQTLKPACEAIAYAHACDVVHRDIKPTNIMVGRFGEVRVMDWGLAKRVGEPERAPSRTDTPLPETWTRTGDHVGTPAYMAPEQARGERDAVGPHTDQYALGAILYEGLTGRRPYADQLTSTTGKAIIAAIRDSEPTPIHRLAVWVPAELAAIATKAMARDPRDRYPTVAAMVDDLNAFLETRVVAAYGRSPWQTLRKWVARNRGLALGVSGVVLVVIGALVTLNVVQASHRRSLRATNQALDEARREAVDNLAGLQGHLYTQQLAAAIRLYDDDEGTAAIRAALEACPPHLRGFEWELLAALSEGCEPLAQCEGAVTCLAVAADGSCFAAGQRGRLEVWGLTPPRRRFTVPGLGYVSAVAVHAGTGLLISRVVRNLQARDLQTGELRWQHVVKENSGGVFSVDGHRVYCTLPGGDLAVRDSREGGLLATRTLDLETTRFAMSLRGDRLAVAGPVGTALIDAETLTEQWRVPHEQSNVDLLAFDADGETLHVGLDGSRSMRLRSGDGHILDSRQGPRLHRVMPDRSVWQDTLLEPSGCWIRLADAVATRLTGHVGRLTSIAAIPGAPWILSASDLGEVRRWPDDLPRVRTVLQGDKEILWLALSPDATRVAATGWDEDVWIWDLASERCILRIAGSPDPKRALAWTSDGTGLLGVGTDHHLCEWDAETGVERRRFALAVGWASPMALSPAGDRVLSADRRNQVVVLDLATDVIRPVGLDMRVCAMAWKPDGTEFYANDRTALHRFDARTLTRTGSIAVPPHGCVIPSPDGRRLYYNTAASVSIVDADTFTRQAETPHVSFYAGRFIPGANRLVTSTFDGRVQVLDPTDGTALLRIVADGSGLHALDSSADGRVLVVAGLSGNVICFRLAERAGPEPRTTTGR